MRRSPYGQNSVTTHGAAGPRVTQPMMWRMLGCGPIVFMRAISAKKTVKSSAVAPSFSVFTATVVVSMSASLSVPPSVTTTPDDVVVVAEEEEEEGEGEEEVEAVASFC